MLRSSKTPTWRVAINRILFVLALVLVSLSRRRPKCPSIQDKTLRIVAGYGAGSVDDAWARHLGKYIPGNPNIIVQNMPGAGAMIAANYVSNVAKPDGLTLGGIRAGLYFDQLVGRKEVQFDWTKFTWLGSPTQVEQLIYMRANTPYKTIHDVRKASVPPKCGATGTASTRYYTGNLLEETIGAKFITLTGYKDGPEVELAVEREEVSCRGIPVETLFGREPRLDVDPVAGENLESLAREVISQPPEVVERAKRLLEK
jgi:tripartite-type tricarboxylate transporter receptor subunit TctC